VSRDGNAGGGGPPQPPPEEPGDTDERDSQLGQRIRESLDEVEARMSPRWQSRMQRFRERIRARPVLDTAWRVGVLALGLTLLTAGAVMFVIPGPGWATIILGLVVLASEFAWASRALDPVKSAARRASDLALDPKRRKRNLMLAAVAGVLAAICVIWYLITFGLTLAPVLALTEWVIGWFLGIFA
jgi:uncharacterized protein (TIGR02611 family)